MGKLENLRNTTWMNATPDIVPAETAYNLPHTKYHFFMVRWWGDEPAGYDRFEFTGFISGGYEIKIVNKWGEMLKGLEADEIVGMDIQSQWCLLYKDENHLS